MADYDTFISSFPEFKDTDEQLVTATLLAATRRVDVPTLVTVADDFIYLLTAQMLARSVTGNSARLDTKDGATVYDIELARMRRELGVGWGIT